MITMGKSMRHKCVKGYLYVSYQDGVLRRGARKSTPNIYDHVCVIT